MIWNILKSTETGERLHLNRILAEIKATIDGLVISGGTPTAWGTITGTLSGQSDLQTALNTKEATGVAAGLLGSHVGLGDPHTQYVLETITVNGQPLSANVTLTATSVGLGSVNNTADSAKPVSTAQAAADAAVQAFAIQRANHTGTQAVATITGLGTLATQSGTFSGTSSGTNTGDQVLDITQISKSIAYTLILTDNRKHIFHPSADTTARIWTIPANSSVAFPIGAAVTFVNQNAAGVITIAITTDTMRLAGAGTTGSRTLAANGIATALKVTATEWIISGTGLT